MHPFHFQEWTYWYCSSSFYFSKTGWTQKVFKLCNSSLLLMSWEELPAGWMWCLCRGLLSRFQNLIVVTSDFITSGYFYLTNNSWRFSHRQEVKWLKSDHKCSWWLDFLGPTNAVGLQVAIQEYDLATRRWVYRSVNSCLSTAGSELEPDGKCGLADINRYIMIVNDDHIHTYDIHV